MDFILYFCLFLSIVNLICIAAMYWVVIPRLKKDIDDVNVELRTLGSETEASLRNVANGIQSLSEELKVGFHEVTSNITLLSEANDMFTSIISDISTKFPH